MAAEQICNLVEGFWWIALGIWMLSLRNKSAGRVVALLSAVLVVFGISDFIEIFTGAWWRPLWLLAIKAVCVAVGIITSIHLYRERSKP